MQRFREFWNAFRNFAIMFSFIMNFVLLIVLIFVLYLIFQIKNGIAEPLIDGLHSNFVGLDEARIETQIPVNDTIPVVFDLPLQQDVEVELTDEVLIPGVPAFFVIEGGGGTIRGTVDIRLPIGTRLPIRLDMMVPVDQDIDIALLVDVDIPLNETQLSVPFNNLRQLLEPYVKILDNLPDEWGEVRSFVFDVLDGKVDLLTPTEDSRNPWKGFDVVDAGSEEASDDQSGADTSSSPDNGDVGTPPATDGPIIAPTPTITPFPQTQ